MRQAFKQGALALLLFLCAAQAFARCTVSAAPLVFGVYQAAQASALDATFNVTYTCAGAGERFIVAFSAGNSGNSSARTMGNGIDVLNYQIYADAARLDPITAGRERVKLDNGSKSDVVPYYARIFASQDVTPGAYSDTLVINITP